MNQPNEIWLAGPGPTAYYFQQTDALAFYKKNAKAFVREHCGFEPLLVEYNRKPLVIYNGDTWVNPCIEYFRRCKGRGKGWFTTRQIDPGYSLNWLWWKSFPPLDYGRAFLSHFGLVTQGLESAAALQVLVHDGKLYLHSSVHMDLGGKVKGKGNKRLTKKQIGSLLSAIHEQR